MSSNGRTAAILMKRANFPAGLGQLRAARGRAEAPPALRGSSFLPGLRSACCARLPRTHPPKVGLMHLSKYFSYAIDVNAVIK